MSYVYSLQFSLKWQDLSLEENFLSCQKMNLKKSKLRKSKLIKCEVFESITKIEMFP